MITYTFNKIPEVESLMNLYHDAGWSNYTDDKNKLKRAYLNSSFSVFAWDGNSLVGVLRAIGDEETIMYVQDIIVLSSHQRQGIGYSLVRHFLQKYSHVRQKVLLTDETSGTSGFYKSCGFTVVSDMNCTAFIRVGE